MSTHSRVGVRLVGIASVYLLVGLALGLATGIGKDFSQAARAEAGAPGGQ